MSEGSSAKGVFIHGSCVCRDSAEFFDASSLRLVEYVARQSLISAFAPKGDEWGQFTPSLASSFQSQAVIGDLGGSLVASLRANKDSIDVVWMDLVDERNGVLITKSGEVVTNSMEFVQSGLGPRLGDELEHVKFGTDDHFTRWCQAVSLLLEALENLGLREKLLVLRHDWATESIEGDVFPFGESKLDPSRVNDLCRRYYNYLSEKEVALLEVPRWLCLTSREHRWGIAPYHYTPEFYSYVAKELAERVAGGHDD